MLLATTHFAAHADRALPAIAAPLLQAHFGIGDTTLGVLLGPAFAAAYIGGTLIAGAYVDRARRYRLIAWSLIVWTLASAAMGLAQHSEQLVIARVVVGLGQAALAPAALAIILQGSPDGKGGRRVATFTSAATLGRGAALLGGGALLAGLSASPGSWLPLGAAPWRALFLISAAPNLVFAILLFRWAEHPAEMHRPNRRGEAWRWARTHSTTLAMHLTVAAAAILLAQAVAAWGPSLFVRAAGTTPAQGAMLAGVVVLIAGPVGHRVGGVLIDRTRQTGGSPAGTLAAMFLLIVPCAVLLSLAHGAIAVMLAYFALTLALGATAVAALAGFQPLVPTGLRGAGNAAYFAIVSLVGSGIGPLAVGFLSDALSAGSAGALGPAVAVLAVAVAVPAAALSYANRAHWSATAAAVEKLTNKES